MQEICLLFVTITLLIFSPVFLIFLWSYLFSDFRSVPYKTLLSKFSQSDVFNMKSLRVHVKMTLCLNIGRQEFEFLICYLLMGSTCKALLFSWSQFPIISDEGESESEAAQSCPTLCDPMDCSLPGSSVYGIFQARVLEWVAISFSRDLPNPGIEPGSGAL